jgi:hypothetical protein
MATVTLPCALTTGPGGYLVVQPDGTLQVQMQSIASLLFSNVTCGDLVAALNRCSVPYTQGTPVNPVVAVGLVGVVGNQAVNPVGAVI